MIDEPKPLDDEEGETNNGKTPRIPSERYDLKILQALRRIIRGVDMHSRRLVGTHDITAPQLICLITAAEDGPITQKQLALRVFLSPSTVVGILDRLEGKGLVLRARDTRDRRLVNVTATTTGRELVSRAPSPLQEGLARSLKDLPEIEQATIALSLQRIVDLMDVDSLDAAPMLDTRTTLSEKEAAGTSGDSEDDTSQTDHGS